MKKLSERIKAILSPIMNYFTEPKVNYTDISLIGVMIVLSLVVWFLRMPLAEALTKTTDITYAYSAKQDGQGLFYVIDEAHTRLLCFDSDSKLIYILNNPSADEDGALYIDDFTVNDGLTYISASEWNGMLLDREVIAVYQGPRFVRTIVNRDYSDMQVNKHRLYGVSVKDSILSYVECEENALIVHNVDLADGTEKTKRFFFDNAFNAVSDCAFYEGDCYVLDKKGSVTFIGDDEREVMYSVSWEGEEDRIPYRLTISEDGVMCITDIRREEIFTLALGTDTVNVMAEGASILTASIIGDGTGLLYVDGDGMKLILDGNTMTYQSLQKPTSMIIRQIIWFTTLVLLIFDCVILLLRFLFSFMRRKRSLSTNVSYLILSAVAVVSFVLCGMLINNFSSIYSQQLLDQIENTALIVAKQIPKNMIDRINSAEDFDDYPYLSLVETMEKVIPYELEFNRQLYCNIQRLSDDGESAYAVAYLDQSIGVFFPLDEYETADVKATYLMEDDASVLWNSSVSDSTGTYMSVKVPIFEYGKVTGVVAMGADTYVIQEYITRMQIEILLSIAVILMLIWLIISEGMAWFNNKDRYKAKLKIGRVDALPRHLIRILVFAIFACYNMTATFLPVWILRNSDIFAESSREFMASLPLTINTFVIGILSLFTAKCVRRLGLGNILAISTICSMSANLVMFLFPSYVTVIVGLLVDGIGVGLITNATYILLTYIQDEGDQQWGLSVYNTAYLAGMNFGMLLGSLLAVMLGQRAVFVIVAIVWLFLMLMENLLVNQLSGLLSTDSSDESATSEQSSISTWRFLFNKPVMSFIVLMLNPYIVFNSFVFYYVPLFCGNMGYDEMIVSMLIMIYSEIAVLTGDLLIQRMSKVLGNHGMYAALTTNVLALIIFAFTRNMLGIVIALILMGTAAAYGRPMQQTWFLKQSQVRKYGEDRAMGVYNFSENIGESLGPIVFARLMAIRPLSVAVSYFCGAVMALGGTHLILNRKGLKELK